MNVTSLSVILVVALGVALAACAALWRTRARLRSTQSDIERLDTELARVRETAATKERLLAAVVEAAPMAIVLFGERGYIAFTNQEARDLFFEGRSPEGEDFLALLANAPDPLRRAVIADRDELVTIEDGGERAVWSLAKRYFTLPAARGADEIHTLLLVKHLTAEMNRQEVETWRRMLRILSHELNNSLAPVSSLMHSARLLAKGSPSEAKLLRVIDTVAERADHLRGFLEGYAELARLPRPRPQDVPWAPFIERIAALWPRARVVGRPVGSGWFDPAQLEQVLINLLKNADEAGGDFSDVELEVESLEGGGARLTVRDRGRGMSDEVMRHALLPFYSTKAGGSGLGLALCREIVEAHGGRVRLGNRDGGGAEVGVRIPGRGVGESPAVKLTLTRS